jgi:hypothetical protein
MMSPDGSLGDVPDDQVAAAQAEGFRVMTSDDLRAMYQRIFMQHSLLQEKDRELARKFQPRRSMRAQMRTRRGRFSR